nr:hypothetical protein [Tanacetum cinerariifolium]
MKSLVFLSQQIPNETKDISDSVVPKEVIEEVVQQPEPKLRKSKRNRNLKNFGHEFQLYLIEGTRDEMDVKTTFFNGDLDEEVYMNQPQGFIMPGDENKVDLTNEFFIKSHYIEKVLKKFNYFDCTPVSTPIDTSEKLMPNNGQAVSQLEYSKVIGCLMYAMTCTRLDIAFVVGKLSRCTSNLGTQHWQINNSKDKSSTSSWVFLLGGGAISWASKKQTCINCSTIESEFVALAVAGKEVECAATLAKAYSQMYNGKSGHLDVRHSMICEHITNGVVSIEVVRCQQAGYLTKGLTRDL